MAGLEPHWRPWQVDFEEEERKKRERIGSRAPPLALELPLPMPLPPLSLAWHQRHPRLRSVALRNHVA